DLDGRNRRAIRSCHNRLDPSGERTVRLTAMPERTTVAGKTPPEEKGRVKLLLVDDDQSNLLALQAILEPLEQELMLAQNGTDALRMCLEHDFAAILLDVRMPDMDGFETAEMIRARKRSLQTPILFVTR